MKTKVLSFIFASFLLTSSLLAAPTQLEMWHAMEGFIEEKLKELVDKFNASQKDYEVHLTRKGNYTETFKEGVKAAKEKNNPPHILQVYEIATPTFRLEKEIYIPAHELLQKNGYKASQEGMIPAIIDFYSDGKGNLQGLPFNISTGLLFYNKEAFQKAGIDPMAPPKTWEDVESYSVKLKNAGYSCAITTAWPSGYLMEHFSARHNLPFTTNENGFKGKGAKLLVNSKEHIFNIEKFAEWQKSGIFKYAGSDIKKAEDLFTNGTCAMLMQSNSRMALLKKPASFEIGGGPIPYWASLTKEPHNLVTGGAALWAIKGHDSKAEKGIAAFFDYVAKPENQQAWVEATGYLTISKAAYEHLRSSSYYEKNPHNEIAIQSLMLPSTSYSKGVRIPGFVEVREIIIDALGSAFSGEKSSKEALNDVVLQGNSLIREAEGHDQKAQGGGK